MNKRNYYNSNTKPAKTKRLGKCKHYNTKAWRNTSRRHRQENPLCELCGKPSEVVHHKQDHKGQYNLFFNLDNLQALCRECHEKIHKRKRKTENIHTKIKFEDNNE